MNMLFIYKNGEFIGWLVGFIDKYNNLLKMLSSILLSWEKNILRKNLNKVQSRSVISDTTTYWNKMTPEQQKYNILFQNLNNEKLYFKDNISFFY